MSIIKANGAGEQSTGFYDFEIENSLLFNGSGGLRISSGEANTSYWTLSVWVKRHKFGGNYATIMSATNYGGTYSTDVIGFGSANTMYSIRGSNANSFTGHAGAAVVRDPTAWYHYCLRNNNGTVTRWLNGVQDSTYSVSGTFVGIGRSGNHDIGAYGGSSESYNNHFSLAEFYFINDSGFNNDNNYDYSQFAEFKNGVLVPKENTLTAAQIGDGGWYYEFKQTGDNADSSGVGADSSGNNHHASILGTVSAHCRATIDTPTNNFCRLNNTGRRYGQSYVGTFSEGNLKVAPGGNATNVFGTMAINQIASQGGVYFEVRMDSLDTNRTYFGVIGDNGADNACAAANAGGYSFPIKGMLSNDPRGHFGTNTDGSSTDLRTGNTAFSDGEVIGIAILSDGKFFAHREGTYLKDASGNVGNPSTGANPIATIDLTLGDWVPYLGYNSSFSINFGQDGTFQGNETSGGNQDANGIGDFMFAVPTNCLALCTSNMAEPAIGPNSTTQADNYFGTLTWSGDSNNTRKIATGESGITGTVDFTPDWSWIKTRNGGANGNDHLLLDIVRGVDSFNGLTANDGQIEGLTEAGSTWVNFGDINNFETGGFTVQKGTDASHTLEGINLNSHTYVGWNWKLGGAPSADNSESAGATPTAGSVKIDGSNLGSALAGSIAATRLSANTTAGTSIVTYTGTGSNATVAHGLSSAPDVVMVKRRTGGTGFWSYWGTQFSATTDYIYLNTTAAEDTGGATITNSTLPASTVFSIGTSSFVNASTDTYVAYCFHSVEGYSKIGNYIGNGDNDGTFVYLGFRPTFIMTKRSVGGTSDWIIQDSVRQTVNPSDSWLRPNSIAVEGTTSPDLDLDFVSNGFKIRNNGTNSNISGSTYIYMAFAEVPFKYANAR